MQKLAPPKSKTFNSFENMVSWQKLRAAADKRLQQLGSERRLIDKLSVCLEKAEKVREVKHGVVLTHKHGLGSGSSGSDI